MVQENELLTLSDIVSSYSGEGYVRGTMQLPIPYSWEFPSIISSNEISSVIGKVLEQPFTFVGGTLLFVPGQFSVSNKASFLMELLKFCNSQLDAPGVRIELESVDGLPEIVSFENIELKMASTRRSLISGRNSIMYKLPEMDQYKRLTVAVRFLKQVYVAAQSISSDAFLSDDLVNIDYRDTRKTSSELFQPAAILSNYYAKKDISNGDILLRTDVKRQYDVFAGKQISVILELGPIQMTMSGYVLRSGNLGDTIQVRMSLTGKKIDGILKTAEVVYVEF